MCSSLPNILQGGARTYTWRTSMPPKQLDLETHRKYTMHEYRPVHGCSSDTVAVVDVWNQTKFNKRPVCLCVTVRPSGSGRLQTVGVGEFQPPEHISTSMFGIFEHVPEALSRPTSRAVRACVLFFDTTRKTTMQVTSKRSSSSSSSQRCMGGYRGRGTQKKQLRC